MFRTVSAVLIACGLSCVGKGARLQVTITVGSNVQVSTDNMNLEHDEVLGCADVHHPERLMVGSIVHHMDTFDPWTTAYVSFDGGKSWAVSVENRRPDSMSQDPACAYGPDGTAYFVALSGAFGGSDNSDLYRSRDGGKKWLPSTTVFGAFDRPYVTVDATGGKYNGRIYVSHKGPSGTALQRSLDGGQAFLGPVLSLGPEDQTKSPIHNTGNTIVLSSGTLVTVFYDTSIANDRGIGKGTLKVIRSSDGGEHYSDIIKVADYYYDSDRRRPHTLPTIAADTSLSSFRGRLYVVWQDTRGGGNRDDQGIVTEESLISYSVDEGKNWSRPVRVNNNLPNVSTGGTVEFQTTVAVSKNGVVGVMWYDGFETPSSQGYSVRFSASLDGAETWIPSVRVSEAPYVFPLSDGIPMAGVGFVSPKTRGPLHLEWWTPIRLDSGDTAGLVADATGIFHAFWVDNRTGHSQVWTAPITVSGVVYHNGAKELTSLDDLSDKVSIRVTHTAFDSNSGKLSTTVFIKNDSVNTITGPLKLRILKLYSEIGSPEFLGSENGMRSEGAILDLSDLLRGNVWKSGSSIEIQLDFQIASPTLRSGGKWHMIHEGHWEILGLDARVFGNRP